MRKLKQKMRSWVTTKWQLPPDILMDLPRITMVGQLHIYIENHRGVLRFSNQELRLRLKKGQLIIKGDGFVIKTILPEELLLEGRIDQVSFINE
ncbi:sporulation protein YqfC [Alkalihalobacillus pseudalcaliphilus]|uniref:sporulation protein YqfC n=1 Tax=Alkalihalobacillus pseudalcaliphilus TaxID=79884 RepID=UPI00064DB586|nr:sporulation protein YqfC [Alkalihalobacillus pseudalcaliphilus]KMK75953.1 sporulation protein YqfC [Alkalihalobacillus pseudalcaliphilus]